MFLKFYSFMILLMVSGTLCANSLQEDIEKATSIVKEFQQVPEEAIPKKFWKRLRGWRY